MASNKLKLASTDAFLDTYKQLEKVLRDVNGPAATVLEYEGSLDADSQNRMTQCRRVRNYLQHTPDSDGFLVVTDAMLSFLKDQISRVLAGRKPVGKLAKKVKPVTLDADVSAACAWMWRNGTDFAPVVDADGHYCGCVDMQMVKGMLAKGIQADSVISSVWKNLSSGSALLGGMAVGDLSVMSKDMAALLSVGGTILVIRESDDKYIGIINRKTGSW